MLSFLHIADVHLERPFGGLPVALAQQRREERWQTFERAIHLCQQEQIDVMLIAGDLWEDEYSTRTMCQRLAYFFKQVTPTQVIITPGNHDAVYNDSFFQTYIWPPNVHVFKEERLTPFHINHLDLTIWGLGWKRPHITHNILANIDIAFTNPYNILQVHGDTTAVDSKYLPLNLRDLLQKGFDYLALGHVHKPQLGDAWGYPGSLEPHDWSEEGDHGAIWGTLSRQGLTLQPVPLAHRRYYTLQIIVGEDDVAEVVADKVIDWITDRGGNHLYRVRLIGEQPPESQLGRQVTHLCQDAAFYVDIEDHILPAFNLEAIASGAQGQGAALFLSKMNALKHLSDTQRHLALHYGLQALIRQKVNRHDH